MNNKKTTNKKECGCGTGDNCDKENVRAEISLPTIQIVKMPRQTIKHFALNGYFFSFGVFAFIVTCSMLIDLIEWVAQLMK